MTDTPPTDRPLTAGDVPMLREGDVIKHDRGPTGTVSRITGSHIFMAREGLPDIGDFHSGFTFVSRPATSAASEGGKFRKKPVVIDAFEMRAEIYGDRSAWPQWLEDAWNLERGAEGSIQNYGVSPLRDGPLQIVTLEGLHNVQAGDWIIRGVKGELYPCKPDVFALTYEPAALASLPVSERERELEGALREIEAMCPATCETSLAHDMAQIAHQALTAQPAGEGK